MMGVTHRVTGLAAGAYAAWGVRAYALPEPAPVYAAVVGVAAAVLLTTLAGRAALWSDLDHHNSRATNSMGILSGLIHEFVHAASCRAFDASATELDVKAGDFRGHRGLTHFAVTAVVLGGLLGALTWTLAARYPIVVLGIVSGVLVGLVADWVWTDIVGSLLGTVIAVAVWTVAPRTAVGALAVVVGTLVGLVVTGLVGKKLGLIATVVSGFATYQLVPVTAIDWTLVGQQAGPGIGLGVGLAVGVGMLAHSIGDAATKTGVPLLWPLKLRGQRYYPIHIRPEGYRLSTGESDWPEMKLRAWCWALTVIAVVGWWPGAWTALWSYIPWPWNV